MILTRKKMDNNTKESDVVEVCTTSYHSLFLPCCREQLQPCFFFGLIPILQLVLVHTHIPGNNACRNRRNNNNSAGQSTSGVRTTWSTPPWGRAWRQAQRGSRRGRSPTRVRGVSGAPCSCPPSESGKKMKDKNAKTVGGGGGDRRSTESRSPGSRLDPQFVFSLVPVFDSGHTRRLPSAFGLIVCAVFCCRRLLLYELSV